MEINRKPGSGGEYCQFVLDFVSRFSEATSKSLRLYTTLCYKTIRNFRLEGRKRHPIFPKYISTMRRGNRRKSAAGKAKPAAEPSASGKTVPRDSLPSVVILR